MLTQAELERLLDAGFTFLVARVPNKSLVWVLELARGTIVPLVASWILGLLHTNKLSLTRQADDATP